MICVENLTKIYKLSQQQMKKEKNIFLSILVLQHFRTRRLRSCPQV